MLALTALTSCFRKVGFIISVGAPVGAMSGAQMLALDDQIPLTTTPLPM